MRSAQQLAPTAPGSTVRLAMMSRTICAPDLFVLLQQVDERQRHLALAQVAADRLAERRGVAGEVEQVVHELERDAEVEAVLAQRLLAARAPTLPSMPPICAQPPNRYAVLRRMISKCSSSVMSASPFLVSWIQLAFDHAQRDVAQQPDDLERVVRERQRHRLDVEVVAEQHRDVVAPPRMHGQPAAPQIGVVDDVVVDERRGVDELDDRRVQHRAVAFVAAQARRHQQHGRPDRACRRSSGCTCRSSGSARPATGRARRTRGRPAPGRRESARKICARASDDFSTAAQVGLYHGRNRRVEVGRRPPPPDRPGRARAARPAPRRPAPRAPARCACRDAAPARETGCRSRSAADRAARRARRRAAPPPSGTS